jgi:UDP-N-acetylmuramate--alanine ligase
MEHVHFIGIGGSGLSAIARLLAEGGWPVSGSDRAASPFANDLMKLGIQVWIGHAPEHVSGADVVVRSSAVPDSNPEVQAALAEGIPVLKRADFLGRLMVGRNGIAVAGTHGKTTTTAMLAWMLVRQGEDPSYIIGGISHDLGTNAHFGRGQAFVIEADEYDRMFLGLAPRIGMVTFIEHDHPDCYPTMADYREAFRAFAGRILPGGLLLTCADNQEAASLVAAAPAGVQARTYGLDCPADYCARELRTNPLGGFSFEAWRSGRQLAQVDCRVPGLHNAANALAAISVAHFLDLDLDRAAAALGEYSGTSRRFELLGEPKGIAIIDDYAHHPTEIRATLAAARARYPGRRIWAVWQPHTYSRTRSLLPEFIAAFGDADCVLVTEIYAARESSEEFSAGRLVARMQHPFTRFIPSLEECQQLLIRELQPGDVLLVLSAGDADQISAAVLAQLKMEDSHA